MGHLVQRIAIDMGEVLADTAAHQLAWSERDSGPGPTAEQVHGSQLSALVPVEHRARLVEHRHDPTFFRQIPVVTGAVEAVVTLSQRYEILVASAAMVHPASFEAKVAWLREYFPMIPPSHCVFCGDKRIIGAGYLIDESPYQLICFTGQPIIFSAAHNAHQTRFRRVRDWADATTQLIGAD